MRTSSFGTIGRSLGRQLDAYVKADATKRAALAPRIIEIADGFFKDSFLPAEKDILTAQLKLYATKSLGYGIAPMVEKIGKDNNYDYSKFVNAAFEISVLTSLDKVKAFLDYPSDAVLASDPLYLISNDLVAHMNAKSDAIAKAQNLSLIHI